MENKWGRFTSQSLFDCCLTTTKRDGDDDEDGEYDVGDNGAKGVVF